MRILIVGALSLFLTGCGNDDLIAKIDRDLRAACKSAGGDHVSPISAGPRTARISGMIRLAEYYRCTRFSSTRDQQIAILVLHEDLTIEVRQ